MEKWRIGLLLSAIIILVSCNLPSGQGTPVSSPGTIYTVAAETVAAELTQVAIQASPTLNSPTSTLTLTPTPASTPTLTKTPIPCLLVGYTNASIDQTVPDNTKMAPGQVFIKTWRLINTGTCTWNSSYELVFDHGDGMGVSSGYAQTMTAGSIFPGQSVDVSVSLTAPSTPGTYTGYWRFRDPNGIYFGIGGSSPWIVKIKVVNATKVTLIPVPDESGSVSATAGPFSDYTAGELSADIKHTRQAFLSFDISAIPPNATITEVKINFKNYTVLGDPFGSLGVMNGYLANWGSTLEPSDFVKGFPPGNIVDWGSVIPLDILEVSPELKAALQAKVGSDRLQLRLQFAGANGDTILDCITFNNPSLNVTYVTP